MLLYLPGAVVSYAHKDEVKPQVRPVDSLLFINPIYSFQATFKPDEFFTDHPFLERILFAFPFAVITSLIYLAVTAVLFLVSERQLIGLRREEFTLRPGTESL